MAKAKSKAVSASRKTASIDEARFNVATTNLEHAIGALDLVLYQLNDRSPESMALGAVRSLLDRVDIALRTKDPLPREWWQGQPEEAAQ